MNDLKHLSQPFAGLRPWAPGLALVVAMLAGCAQDLPGKAVPDARLYFPGSLAISNDGARAYIVNTNFDQAYQGGWISTIPLADFRAELGKTDKKSLTECQKQLEDGDEAPCLPVELAQSTKGLVVPSLTGQLAISKNQERALLTSRGSNPLTLLEIDAEGVIRCGPPKGEDRDNDKQTAELSRTDCDNDHFYAFDDNIATGTDFFSLNVEPFVDPYAVTFLDDNRFAVGFLDTEYIGFFEWTDGKPTPIGGVVLQSSVADVVGSLALWSTDDGADVNRIVGTTRYAGNQNYATQSALISINVDTDVPNQNPDTSRVAFRRHSSIGSDLVDIEFTHDGQLAYVLSESLQGLLVVDTKLSPSLVDGEVVNAPRFETVGFLSIPGRPLGMAMSADENFLFVTTFDGDGLVVVQPNGVDPVEARTISPLCDGPFEAALATVAAQETLLVTCFYDHQLRMIDVSADQADGFFVVGGL